MSDVSRETSAQLEHFVALLIDENQRQNLIAKSTVEDLWKRHIEDAAQLAAYHTPGSTWLDIGSGAGLPGIVVAILTASPMILVEPRRLRAEFLRRVIDELQLQASVVQARVEALQCPPVDIITARAVAPIDKLFAMALHLSRKGTIWALPKGRNAHLELEQAKKSWQGDFRLEPSRTDPDARIVIASRVQRKSRARGVA
jgi:16S rRNA (guanine527-N7)-methyltransferase